MQDELCRETILTKVFPFATGCRIDVRRRSLIFAPGKETQTPNNRKALFLFRYLHILISTDKCTVEGLRKQMNRQAEHHPKHSWQTIHCISHSTE